VIASTTQFLFRNIMLHYYLETLNFGILFYIINLETLKLDVSSS